MPVSCPGSWTPLAVVLSVSCVKHRHEQSWSSTLDCAASFSIYPVYLILQAQNTEPATDRNSLESLDALKGGSVRAPEGGGQLGGLVLSQTPAAQHQQNFSRIRTPASPVSIKRETVKKVQEYKQPGKLVDQELWGSSQQRPNSAHSHVEALFIVCADMVWMFQKSVVAYTDFHTVICWGTALRVDNANILQALQKSSSVLRTELDLLHVVSSPTLLFSQRNTFNSGQVCLLSFLLFYSIFYFFTLPLSSQLWSSFSWSLITTYMKE